MEYIREYVISVVASAFVCGIVMGVFPKGAVKEVVKMICGLFLAFTALSPISRLDFSALTNHGIDFSEDAAQTAAIGEVYSEKAIRDIIKAETQAYILDKAAALGASITADVSLSADEIPVPVGVQVSGVFSPYVRQRLTDILQEELGIAKENQLWTRSP